MQDLKQPYLAYAISHQHQETTLSRIKQDYWDLEKIKDKRVTCMPFPFRPIFEKYCYMRI